MFEQMMEKYQIELTNYCRMLTGTPWDAEDLYQETILKAFKHKDTFNSHPKPKAFLYKIASTTWLDICRKNKIVIELGDVEINQVMIEDEDPILLEDLIEEFASSLPPKQAIVILFVDFFRYSLKETAEMIDLTIGAVKSLLHRGRKNLTRNSKNEGKEKTPKEMIISFQQAIQLGNPSLISIAYKNLVKVGFNVKRLHGRKSFTIYDPEGNMISLINN